MCSIGPMVSEEMFDDVDEWTMDARVIGILLDHTLAFVSGELIRYIFVYILLLQIFVFSLNPKNEDWRFYDWNKVTTVVMVGYLDMQLVCLAHKYGARAMTIGKVTQNKSNLTLNQQY